MPWNIYHWCVWMWLILSISRSIHAFSHTFPLNNCQKTSSISLAHIHYGLALCCYHPLTIIVYSNVAWVGNRDDFTSISACVSCLGATISRCSKKQRTVARSSMEIEYWANASIAAKLTWIDSQSSISKWNMFPLTIILLGTKLLSWYANYFLCFLTQSTSWCLYKVVS